ncbi:MAG: hypothetical protein ACHP84_18225 [Caulobacterales bacterium]
MRQFVAQSNLQRFQHLLALEQDETQKNLLGRLIEAEEAKLKALAEAGLLSPPT